MCIPVFLTFDRSLQALGNRNHDISSKNPKYVIHEESPQQNEACLHTETGERGDVGWREGENKDAYCRYKQCDTKYKKFETSSVTTAK